MNNLGKSRLGRIALHLMVLIATVRAGQPIARRWDFARAGIVREIKGV